MGSLRVGHNWATFTFFTFPIPSRSECGGQFGLKTYDSPEKGRNRLIQLQSKKFKICLVEVLMVGANPAVDPGRQKWTRPTSSPQEPMGKSHQEIPKNRHLTKWLHFTQDMWHSLLPPQLITLPQTQRDSLSFSETSLAISSDHRGFELELEWGSVKSSRLFENRNETRKMWTVLPKAKECMSALVGSPVSSLPSPGPWSFCWGYKGLWSPSSDAIGYKKWTNYLNSFQGRGKQI